MVTLTYRPVDASNALVPSTMSSLRFLRVSAELQLSAQAVSQTTYIITPEIALRYYVVMEVDPASAACASAWSSVLHCLINLLQL